jgi:putative membrane protein
MVAMMLWYGSGLAFWEAALTGVGMIVFWGLLIWAVYALFTSNTRRLGQNHHHHDARRILDERLARGEISAEEYRRLRDLIGPDHQAPAGTGAESGQ